MDFGNVLVIGNSGVGKSTLINAVLGEDLAKVGDGSSGVTKKLEIYESKDGTVPFRIIDTIGFEPSFIKRTLAIQAVRAWSRDAARDGKQDSDINVIWFCVDGTSRKLFPEAIRSLSKATSLWKSVPVIVVITKSYSEPEREENKAMVYEAFAKERSFTNNLKAVIPVVAETYRLNDTAFAAPDGISELIGFTNDLMPEGKRAAEKDVAAFKLRRKRGMAQAVVAASTAAAAGVGTAPIPIPDALVLSPIEAGEINMIASIYDVDRGESSKAFFDTIIEVGTVSAVAKSAITALKAVPGLSIAVSVLNGIIAASIVAAIGEGSIQVFEKVYTGEKTTEDLTWLREYMESKLTKDFVTKVTAVIEKVAQEGVPRDVPQLISRIVMSIFTSDGKDSENKQNA